MDRAKILRELKPEKDFFIGIDSDGCVFDTMEVKHKKCFCPNFINSFKLQKARIYAMETWEFVNLYSQFRGLNRFLALIEVFRILIDRPEIIEMGIHIPDITSLEEWVGKETKLGNPALKKYADSTGNDFLYTVLEWSDKVNLCVSEIEYNIPPFQAVLESLKTINEKADTLVVSQTPLAALQREWKENGLDSLVRFIAGQEHGTKSEHLAFAAKGKYLDSKILMIGDAPGDYEAARSNGVQFYPIIPGLEEASWKHLLEEALDRFFKGNYVGKYENNLIHEFYRYLPEKPPWKLKIKQY